MRLTTTGRRSGKERTVIVGYLEDGTNLVTMAMNGWDEGHPAWWLNLEANPEATVRLADRRHARSVPGAPRVRSASASGSSGRGWISASTRTQRAARPRRRSSCSSRSTPAEQSTPPAGVATVDDTTERPTFVERQALSLRGLRKFAKKHPDEPLSPDDWDAYWAFGSQPSNRALERILRALPTTPRCGYCCAPFSGIGGRLLRPLDTGRRARTRTSPSRASSSHRPAGALVRFASVKALSPAAAGTSVDHRADGHRDRRHRSAR